MSYQLLECLNINPMLFKLFIYSLVWRCSISTLPEFFNFRLKNETEDEIRKFLKSSLRRSHQELIISLPDIIEYPKYNLCVFKPKHINIRSRGILAAYQMSDYYYGIFTSDLIIYFFQDERLIDDRLQNLSNDQNNIVKIILANTDSWQKWCKAVINKIL